MKNAILSQLLRVSLEQTTAVVATEDAAAADTIETSIAAAPAAVADAEVEAVADVAAPMIDEAAPADAMADETPAAIDAVGDAAPVEAASDTEVAAIADAPPVTDAAVSEEGLGGAVVGGLGGMLLAGPVGAAVGATAGHFIQKGLQKDRDRPQNSRESQDDGEVSPGEVMDEVAPIVDEAAPADAVAPDAIIAAAAPAAMDEMAPAAAVEEVVAEVAEEVAPAAAEIAPDQIVDVVADDAAPAADMDSGAEIEVPGYSDYETSTDEVDQTGGEIDEAEEAVGELSDVADGLEAICNEMNASLRDGGLHPQAAKFMHIAVESYTGRLGYTQPLAAGLESFGGQTPRREATKISMESVKEFLSKVWEAIKAALAKIKTLLIKFLQQIMVACGHVEIRATKLEQALNDVPASFAAGHKDGKLLYKGEIPQPLRRLLGGPFDSTWSTLHKGMKALQAAAIGAIRFDTDVGDQLDKDFSAIKAAVASRNGPKLSLEDGVTAPPVFSVPGDSSLSTAVLPGNVTFSIDVADPDWKAGRFTTYRVTKHVGEQREDDGKVEWAILTLDAVKDILLFARTVVAARAEIGKEQKVVAAAIKEINALVLPDDLDDAVQKDISEAIRIFKQRSTAQGQAAAKVMGYVVSCIGGYLTWAEMSVKAYSGDAAKPAAAE